MIGNSGVFQSIPCPDPQCKRPYCHFSHSEVASNSQAFPSSVGHSSTSYSASSSNAQSTVPVEITQESGDAYGSSYTGYYSASYSPAGYNSYSAYAPIAPNYEVGSTYYEANTDDSKKETKSLEDDSSRKRKRTLSSEEPSKPRLPPDLGSDPLLTSLEKKVKKETVTIAPVSKKAKRIPMTASMADSKAKDKGRTEQFNQYVQKITEIDRQLAQLKKLTEKPKTSSIDALFDVDDEPPPRPVTQKSLSGSSTDSLKQSKIPFPKKKSIDTPSDDDVIVIDPKPASVPKNLTSTSIPGKNQRVAHVPAFSTKPKGPPLPSPMMRRQTLAEQLAKRREAAAAMKQQSTDEQKRLAEALKNNTTGKVRIAHVPKSPVKVDAKVLPPSRPEPIDPKAKKFSINLRRKTLQKLIDEFTKFMSYNDAVLAAQREEHELMQKAAAQSGYLSGMTGVLRRVKEMNGTTKQGSLKNKVSHLEVLKGKHSGSISLGVNSGFKKNADRVKELSEAELYEEFFDKYLLSDQQLEDNGYPLWVDEMKKDLVKIKLRDNESLEKVFVDENNPFRACCRCNKKFRVKLQEDDVVEEDDCNYHWGKLWRKKEHATWVSKYTCCGGDGQAEGCCLAKTHVTQMYPKSVLKEFVEAPPRREGFDDRSMRVVALDCEMVYTAMGYSVARLSVVNCKGEKILDELIKPPAEVLDTNFRFSGLKPEDVNGAKLDLAGAQGRFFEIVNRDSILIGHSLESDLKAMRIVHKNVIDTSVLYPHKQGPPFKRALKNLSSEVLMKIIQEDVTGHDSAEDAQITLELVLHKLMNE
ncbi:hypothetical protein FO519_000992 [Halicephalobus sp. NKZ332]|nr:hypothetical protein FO519_000992 [Halicephalobus sp. NKZ332]